MPPRQSLTSSFSIIDANNEVVCPLRNQDGSSCRKRCIGVSTNPIFLPRRARRRYRPRATAARAQGQLNSYAEAQLRTASRATLAVANPRQDGQ
ncbi:hypothetical protein BJ166DRAFT_103155 [Pestalotiopsis sp. NC0098]|nr:hypothetical protein BJ166DRAFT_103155 [Pestalotiopsis sp. NC0098]